MAEAVVEERPMARFYCHMCNVEFQDAANNFTCPHCSDGFIEELEDHTEEAPAQRSGDSSHSHRADSFRYPNVTMDAVEGLFRLLPETTSEGNTPLFREERTFAQLPISNLRQPIEHLVQDFFVSMGVGVGVNIGGPSNIQLFLGNPGDYAWGREGLDAIVTQLLNQMESTGPPPLSKTTIDGIEIVEVNEEQVQHNLQCAVCWEQFTLKEQVRQLPCTHIYHENCIRPWLELHGTCPICRQNLNDNESGDTPSENQDQSGIEAVTNEATNVQSVLRSLFGIGSNNQNNSQQQQQQEQMDQSESNSGNS